MRIKGLLNQLVTDNLRHRLICPYCDFLRPNCMCAIGTKIANDNEKNIVPRYSD